MCTCIFNTTFLSNDCKEFFPQNSLNNFTMKLPFSKTLRNGRNEKWFLAIKSVGLSGNFKRKASDKPTLIQLFQNVKVVLHSTAHGESKFEIDWLINSEKNINCYIDKDEITNYASSEITRKAAYYAKYFDYYFKDQVTKTRSFTYTEAQKERSEYKLLLNKYLKSTDFFVTNQHFSTENFYESINTLFRDPFINIANVDIVELDIDKYQISSNKPQFLLIKNSITELCDIRQETEEMFKDEKMFTGLFYLTPNEIKKFNRSVMQIHDERYEIFVLNKYYKTIIIEIKKEKLFRVQEGIPEIVKLKCFDIRSQISNDTHSQDLEIIKLNFNRMNLYHYHEFENLQYVPLLSSTLNHLSFQLTDETDNLLNFDYGVPTFIEISLKKMDARYKSYSVYLSTFGDTTDNASNFIKSLPKDLKFKTKWYCGLKDITFPNYFRTFPSGSERITIYEMLESGGRIKSLIEIDNINFTPENLIHFINNKIPFQNKLKFSIINNKTRIESDDHTYRINMSKALACVLGLILPSEYLIREYAVTLTVEKNSRILGKAFVNLNHFKPQYLMIYCNIIKNSIIGNEYSNLLRIVPIDQNNKRSHQTVDFKNITFHEIANYLVNRIKIEIRDHSGNIVNFENNNINLHLYFTNEPQI